VCADLADYFPCVCYDKITKADCIVVYIIILLNKRVRYKIIEKLITN